MTLRELQVQDSAISALRTSERFRTIKIDDYEFTLRDVERRCEAYVYSKPYGELQCTGNTRIVGRRCELFIDNWPNGTISCRGSALTIVARRCTISMYSAQYGSVSC